MANPAKEKHGLRAWHQAFSDAGMTFRAAGSPLSLGPDSHWLAQRPAWSHQDCKLRADVLRACTGTVYLPMARFGIQIYKEESPGKKNKDRFQVQKHVQMLPRGLRA